MGGKPPALATNVVKVRPIAAPRNFEFKLTVLITVIAHACGV
jgi:hypothetical protein